LTNLLLSHGLVMTVIALTYTRVVGVSTNFLLA